MFNKLKISLFTVFFATFFWPVSAQIVPEEAFTPWLESWNNWAYYETNSSRIGFSSPMLRSEGKIGFTFYNLPVKPYFAYYAVFSSDKNYYNNAIYSGVGLRVQPFQSLPMQNLFLEWVPDAKLFVENLSSSYLADQANTTYLKNTDFRYGLDVWHEWNLKDNPQGVWSEMWLQWSHRSTNFSWTDFDNWILYWQQKFGVHLPHRLEPYIRVDLTKSGTSESYLNLINYGVGVRIEPWRDVAQVNPWLEKFKMYLEFMTVSYLDVKPAQPVSSDVRFGVDFTFGL